jgi:hypothetical protein
MIQKNKKTQMIFEATYLQEDCIELTQEEIKIYLLQKAKDEKAREAQKKANETRAKLKADTLAKLGLTADEVAALLS